MTISEREARDMLKASGMSDAEVDAAIEQLRAADPLIFLAADASRFAAQRSL